MNDPAPPPLPMKPRLTKELPRRIVPGLAIAAGFCVAALVGLHALGLVRQFSVPTSGMAPAISAGDHVIMDGLTYLTRKPRRGDVVAFKTDRIGSLPAGEIYIKRIAGEPGDHLRISEGKLFINDAAVTLSNKTGVISYFPPQNFGLGLQTDVTVPADSFFVLGDNSTNSSDSRFWGSVPRENVLGRISFCYWPASRNGGVK